MTQNNGMGDPIYDEPEKTRLYVPPPEEETKTIRNGMGNPIYDRPEKTTMRIPPPEEETNKKIGMGNPIYDKKSVKDVDGGVERKKETCETKQAKANKCKLDKIR